MKQIVIEITDKIYEKVKEHYVNPYEVDEICEAILDGTPLPKGHGRLIDADEVYDAFRPYVSFTDLCDTLDALPTIIEADKEG